jgi:hypothetical protein
MDAAIGVTAISCRHVDRQYCTRNVLYEKLKITSYVPGDSAMTCFLRWLVFAVFVAAVFGAFAGEIAKQAASVPAEERDPSVPLIKYEIEEDEAFRLAFFYTAGILVVLCAIAAFIRLPEAAKSISIGAVVGVALAVFGGFIVSALRGEPGFYMKSYPSSLKVALYYGVPVFATRGAFVGFSYHHLHKSHTGGNIRSRST